MGEFVVAIDQGTTSTKVVVVDGDGNIVGTASSEVTQYFPHPGWVEHDPDEIWRGVVSSFHAALASAGVQLRDVAALGITNQRETTVVWDRASGAPIARALVWQDRRTADACATLRAHGAEELVRARTGLSLDPYFSATKIAWLLTHVSGARERAHRGELAFGTVDSWLLWRLTNGAVHATDVTNASRTGLFNVRTQRWDEELCALYGVPASLLGDVVASQSIVALSAAPVLGAPIPIGGVLGDQQAALYAQGCVRAGETKATYGTGAFLLQHTGARALFSSGALLTTTACTAHEQPAQFALEGSIFSAGATMQWLRDGLGLVSDVAESDALARSLSDNGDVWCVPALAGLGSPTWDPSARGLLIGLTRASTRAHVVRAALEAVAYQTRDVIDEMNALSSTPCSTLRVDGGMTTNEWLVQFLADVVGITVAVAPSTEATALGSALAAGVSAGVWASGDVVWAHQRDARRYEPAMGSDQRDALQDRWRLARDRSTHWAAS